MKGVLTRNAQRSGCEGSTPFIRFRSAGFHHPIGDDADPTLFGPPLLLPCRRSADAKR